MMFKLKPLFVFSTLVVILAVSVTIFNTDHYKVVNFRLGLSRNYPLLKYLEGLFRKTRKDNEILGTPGSPYCVRWLAPILSGGGYSTEAWSYILALGGLDENVKMSIEQHGDLLNMEFWEGLPEEMRKLAVELHQTKCRLNETIIVCHSEPGAWYPPLFETLPCPEIGYGKYRIVIGRTMFETDRVNAHHVERCNRMDYVWVPTDFHVTTFVQSGVDPSKVVKIVQPVDWKFFDPVKYKPFNLPSKGTLVLGSRPAKKSDNHFVFLSVFKWEYRKGWDVLLRSYLKEFSEADGVSLYLLTNPYYTESDFGNKILEFVAGSDLKRPAHGWAPVYVIDSHIAQIDFPRIYKAADAFVLPSRGEGWGRPIVEAMAMSLPVIITNWSGPTEYMTKENSYPLPVERMSDVMEGPFQGHLWAEPSADKLQNLMRHVMSNPEEAKAKGRQAREDMINRYSPEIVAGIVRDHLQQIFEKTL
ncbi:uncharacterized protein LOC108206027 [Daucus carota subsp. sativus]|nr:PREDICTED: uncharacterized protein LOC108206027 [Daucus carota subsp. sativus]